MKHYKIVVYEVHEDLPAQGQEHQVLKRDVEAISPEWAIHQLNDLIGLETIQRETPGMIPRPRDED